MVSKRLFFAFIGIFLISFVSAISITYPSNTNYGAEINYFDWDHSDINESICWYSLDEGINNYTMSTCDTRQDDSTIISNEGNNTWTVWANDSLGTIHTASVNFWVDSVSPNLSLVSPSSLLSFTNQDTLTFQFRLDETNKGSYHPVNFAPFSLNLYDPWSVLFDIPTLSNISAGDNTLSEAYNKILAFPNLAEGNYTYVVKAKDVYPNGTMIREVEITGIITRDTTAPVITLIGDDPQFVEFNTTPVELNATAIDNLEGDISDKIVIDYSLVDVNVLGNHSATYDVTDSAGNPAITVYRNVSVIDSTPPVLNIIGDNPQEIEVFSTYTELGANATDNYDGDLTSNISINNSDVNTSAVGSYIIIYSVSDSFGNSVNDTRTINVVDTTAPVITLNNGTQTIERGTSYTELGANATDNYDGDISGSIVIDTSSLNVDVAGNYNISYYVEDASGNNDTQIRTVNVVDTINPEIEIVYPIPNVTYIVSNIDLKVNTNEPATWKYKLNNGTNITFTPNTTLSLDNGDYNLTVWVEDPSGNVNSSKVSFNVNVPSPKSTSSSGGSSCRSVWNCTLWSGWSSCENNTQKRVCFEKERVKCGKGITLDELKENLTRECIPFIVETIEENTEEKQNLTATLNTEEINKSGISPITGGVIGNFTKSKTGFVVLSFVGVVLVSWLGLILRKKFEKYHNEFY